MNGLPDVEDAIQFIVRYVREGRRRNTDRDTDYPLDVPNVMRAFAAEGGVARNQIEAQLAPLSLAFYAAAWELCRKGALRPGYAQYQPNRVGGHGWDFSGYAVTPFGETWISGLIADYVPVEPGRLARMFADRGGWFGSGFVERAQEAVKAYNAQAFLACCAMCGAACESAVLALAIAKVGNEERVLREYAATAGRGRIERTVLKGQPERIATEFRRYTDLLKYWRDSASHGRAAQITEAEAYTTLVLLLRFAIFASEHQLELTGVPE